MRIEVLCTGDELLTGLTADTNSPFFMERLLLLGEQVAYEQIVGDELDDIVRAIKEAAERADVVLVSGGLGPTMDDLTAEAAAKAAGVKLFEHAETWENIQARFKARGLTISANNRKVALVPEGAEVVRNPVGSAPMFVLRIGRCTLFFVAGVPREYKALVEQEVLPRIRKLLEATPDRTFLAGRILKTMILPESQMDALVRPLFQKYPKVKFGTRTRAPENHLKLYAEGASPAEANALLGAVEAEARAALGDAIFGEDDERYDDVLLRQLKAAKKTVAVAESCTGGLVAERLTSPAGASEAFKGGFVVYTEEAKIRFAGVPRELILREGVVSEAVAKTLAENVRAQLGTDYGLGITGYAGPGGGTERDPVGTVYVACAGPDGTEVGRHLYTGDRDRVRAYATAQVLELLRHQLARTSPYELRFVTPDNALYAHELELRFRVLREPLGHKREDVAFPFEKESLHLLALQGGEVKGCVLFHPESGKDGRLFQMAVRPELQKSGLGARLVRALEAELVRRGFNSVHLHARAPVVGFYERLGYQVYGEPFEEVGIPHRHMRRTIG